VVQIKEEAKIISEELYRPISREITHHGHHFPFKIKALLNTNMLSIKGMKLK